MCKKSQKCYLPSVQSHNLKRMVTSVKKCYPILSIELSFSHQQNILYETFFAKNILQQSCVISNVLKSSRSPSLTSDQNFNMADNEENCSGEMRDLPLAGEWKYRGSKTLWYDVSSRGGGGGGGRYSDTMHTKRLSNVFGTKIFTEFDALGSKSGKYGSKLTRASSMKTIFKKFLQNLVPFCKEFYRLFGYFWIFLQKLHHTLGVKF